VFWNSSIRGISWLFLPFIHRSKPEQQMFEVLIQCILIITTSHNIYFLLKSLRLFSQWCFQWCTSGCLALVKRSHCRYCDKFLLVQYNISLFEPFFFIDLFLLPLVRCLTCLSLYSFHSRLPKPIINLTLVWTIEGRTRRNERYMFEDLIQCILMITT